MMRSLWTAASGMISQQLNVDTIAHNLSNVNTTAYKKERLEFKSLLYQTMQRADLDPQNQGGRPVNLQVGLGVRPIASSRGFTQGNMEATDNRLDVAIDGDGFFAVQRGAEIMYSRDGSFKVSSMEDGELMLVSSEGYPILSIDDEPIILPAEVNVNDLVIGRDGTMEYMSAEGEQMVLEFQLNVVQFQNPQGLEAVGENLFKVTGASGQAIPESEGTLTRTSDIVQGYLEMSNVQVAEEMVKLIVAQRAYELNSKAIQTSDDMLQQANNLKRS